MWLLFVITLWLTLWSWVPVFCFHGECYWYQETYPLLTGPFDTWEVYKDVTLIYEGHHDASQWATCDHYSDHALNWLTSERLAAVAPDFVERSDSVEYRATVNIAGQSPTLFRHGTTLMYLHEDMDFAGDKANPEEIPTCLSDRKK